MTCPNCTALANYHFATSCVHCEDAVSVSEEKVDAVAPPVTSSKSCQTFVDHVFSAIFILLFASLGVFLGAVVMYFVGVIAYLAFLQTGNPSNDCAAGGAVAALSILFGGYLGCIIGSIQGYRNRTVYRERLKEC